MTVSALLAELRAISSLPAPLLTTIYQRGLSQTHSHEAALERVRAFHDGTPHLDTDLQHLRLL